MEVHPEEVKLLVRMLRAKHGGSRAAFGKEVGLTESSVWRFERGEIMPRRRTLEDLARAAGVGALLIDAVLLPAIRAIRAAEEPWAKSDQVETDGAAALAESLQGAVLTAIGGLEADLEAAAEEARRAGPPLPEDRLSAATLWQRLEPLTPAERRVLLQKAREYQSWALAERLAEESSRAAADDSTRALELAELALAAAELTPGEEAWRCRVLGYIWAFVGNARRVGSDLAGAEEAFAEARRLWQAGAASDSILLGEWRLLDLEASLCRDLRQWPQTLSLLDRARAAAPPEAEGRILLKRAFTLEPAGEIEASLATLREAAPLIEQTGDPRQLFGLRFNLITLLCHLGRFMEARTGLPELRQRVKNLDNDLDLIRVRWLEGRVAAGLGDKAKARAAFDRVRRDFEQRDNAYDAALVSLDLAVLYLEQGETGKVRSLAEKMLWIFRSKKIHREALAALALFRHAAEAETATLDLAHRLLAYLERARHDTRLPFGEPA